MSPKHTLEHEDGCRRGLRHVPTNLAGACQHSLINHNGAAAVDRLLLKPELELHRARDNPQQECGAAGKGSQQSRDHSKRTRKRGNQPRAAWDAPTLRVRCLKGSEGTKPFSLCRYKTPKKSSLTAEMGVQVVPATPGFLPEQP